MFEVLEILFIKLFASIMLGENALLKIRKPLKIIILLSIIWLAIVIPIPFLWIYPSLWHSEEYKTYVVIAVLLSIPLAVRGIIWIKKPNVADYQS